MDSNKRHDRGVTFATPGEKRGGGATLGNGATHRNEQFPSGWEGVRSIYKIGSESY